MSTPFRTTQTVLDVLGCLAAQERPVHGYVVVKHTRRPSGSVYPVLHRLASYGWLSSQWEEDWRPILTRAPRRLYALTDDGARLAGQLLAERRPHGKEKAADGRPAVTD